MSNAVTSPIWRRVLTPVVCTLTLLIPVLAWLVSTGNPFAYVTHHVPPGQTFFVLAKLCGLMALVLFWLQCMTALAKFAPALRGFFQLKPRQHALLGAVTFGLVLTHLTLFIVASSLRTGHLALPLLLPRFDQGFYSTYISFGAVGFWILLLVVFAGVLRMRDRIQWRWLHRLGFFVFALGFLHGVGIGSETRFGMMKYIYAFIGLSLATAVCSWAFLKFRHLARRPDLQITAATRVAVGRNE